MASTTHQQNPVPALIRISQVHRLTGLSNSAIYRGVQSGTFPRPLKLTERSSAWVETEVLEWIAARIAERDKASSRAA
ncbi:MAG: AlpA family phage regulatory protein [Pseudomonadales bacterium]|nr:AlpA family phage regulatory protein [Pseudomonadales bacterium]